MAKSIAVATIIGLATVAGVVSLRGKANPPTPVSSTTEGSETASPTLAPGATAPGAAAAVQTTSAFPDAGSFIRDPRAIFTATWGSGLGQLGRSRPQEGNPEGPKSFAVTDDGYIVLDQVNERLVRYDAKGKPIGTIPVSETSDDIAAGKDSMAVLDRLVQKKVTTYDASGRKTGEYALDGAKGIKEPGTTSGVFMDGKKVYVEREHGGLVMLGGAGGQPSADGTELSGRPSKDGALLLSAGVLSARAGVVYVNVFDRAKNGLRFTQKVALGPELKALLLLDSDARGTIYVGAWMTVAGEQPPDSIRVFCISSADGRTLGQTSLPTNDTPEESFRDLAVGADGSIVYAWRSEQGVQYLRATCP
ncbi:hypothetical protein [Pendulispora albinea]|uniref:Uncharacterized protein n=1 Tax=Pendulispora albinea TaxID=2741071 RepID=A0ABZ2LY36_9BACT